MLHIKFVYRCIALTTVLAAAAWGVVPVTVLGESADLIVIGRLLSMTGGEMGAAEARIRPVIVMKGQAPPSSVTAILPASPLMKQHAGRYAAGQTDPKYAYRNVDPYGLWFLKRVSEEAYEILPTEKGEYTENAAFIPLPAWWTPPSEGDLDQKLLAAVKASYQSTENPSSMQKTELLESLQIADRDEALAVANELMNSSSTSQRILGFVAAIRQSSDEVFPRLARELDTLRLDKDFHRITFALQTYYQPSGSSSIEVLSKLIGLHSEGPDSLDVGVSKALQKIGTKEILPAMLRLMDSPNTSVKKSACWYFHYFTALADLDGTINRSGISGRHPFFTEETRIHTGRNQVDVDTAFWKSWWAENKEKLGFTTAASSQ